MIKILRLLVLAIHVNPTMVFFDEFLGMAVFILVLAIHVNPTVVFFDEFSYFNENYNEIFG